jgi:hypothetical protein
MTTTTLHRLSWKCPEEGRQYAWFTTANKAMQFARRMKIADEARFDMVEIPKTRVELCKWLNNNTNG